MTSAVAANVKGDVDLVTWLQFERHSAMSSASVTARHSDAVFSTGCVRSQTIFELLNLRPKAVL